MAELLPNPLINVENEFSKAIGAIEGRRVDELLERANAHKNADFIFDKYSVIAELKCLEKDQIHDREFVKKTSALYVKYLKMGRAPFRAYGTVIAKTDGFPASFQKAIADLYAVPIGRIVRTADRQIKETRAALSRHDHKGVLLLVNNGNTALNPVHITWSLGQFLRDGRFPDIHHVIFFTANMPVSVPDPEILNSLPLGGMDMHVWFSAGREDRSRIDPAFQSDLRAAWLQHTSKICGRAGEFQGNDHLFESLENKPS